MSNKGSKTTKVPVFDGKHFMMFKIQFEARCPFKGCLKLLDASFDSKLPTRKKQAIEKITT